MALYKSIIIIIIIIIITGPARKEKQFALPDDFSKIEVTILSRTRHPASGFPTVFRAFTVRTDRCAAIRIFLSRTFEK